MSAVEIYSFVFVIFRWLPDAMIVKFVNDTLSPVVAEIASLSESVQTTTIAFEQLAGALRDFQIQEAAAFEAIADGYYAN